MNENEVKAKFDEIIKRSDLFTVYEEVDGFYLQPRATGIIKSPRIDRILTPTKKAFDLGYNYGIIGVELKATGHNEGTTLVQMFDYIRATYFLIKNDVYYGSVLLDTGFVFPFDNFTGSMESITKQTLIGTGNFYKDGLTLQFGSIIFLRIFGDDIKIISPNVFNFGKKVGSR